MVLKGSISSLFDFLTFFILLFVLNANEPMFQAAWFIESLCTQILVIFVIRTRKIPFYKSQPSRSLLASSLSIVIIALIVPFTPLAIPFRFIKPNIAVLGIFPGLIVAYLSLVELTKKWFYKHYANT